MIDPDMKQNFLEAMNDRHFKIEEQAVKFTRLAAEWNKLRDLSVDCVNGLLAGINEESIKALDEYIKVEFKRLSE